MNAFFEGIENDVAFCFCIDSNGNLSPAGKPRYHLFNSDIYPFIAYAEELSNINVYCYEVSHLVTSKYYEAINNLNNANARKYWDTFNIGNYTITNDQIQLGLECDTYTWKSIMEHCASHLCVLLFSFIERVLKEIKVELFNSKKADCIHKQDKSKRVAHLYEYLSCILGLSIEQIKEKHSELYTILESARKFRNKSVHETYNSFGTKHTKIDFCLIELIDTISNVLELVEKQYIKTHELDKHNN